MENERSEQEKRKHCSTFVEASHSTPLEKWHRVEGCEFPADFGKSEVLHTRAATAFLDLFLPFLCSLSFARASNPPWYRGATSYWVEGDTPANIYGE